MPGYSFGMRHEKNEKSDGCTENNYTGCIMTAQPYYFFFQTNKQHIKVMEGSIEIQWKIFGLNAEKFFSSLFAKKYKKARRVG